MKKIKTEYTIGKHNQYCLQVSEEVKDHICITEFMGEGCSGILRHWDSQKGLVKELRELADELEKIDLKK